MNSLISTNPADNYSTIGQVDISQSREIADKIKAANQVKTTWKETSLQNRIELLRPIQQEFAQRAEQIAQLITKEVGKPIAQTRGEADSTTKEFQWLMDHVESAMQDEITHEDKGAIHRIVYEPFGTAAVITPWNAPFKLSIWGIVPNLLVGNTVVLKISEECPMVGKLVEEVFSNHSLPEGVFAEIFGDGDVSKQLSESEIDFIWFTGGTKTGKSLYQTASKKFIKAILEMGGSSPGIVFADVDMNTAAETIYSDRFDNCGQYCDAVKRLIVHESISNNLLEALAKTLTRKVVGNPIDETTDIGSLVAKRQLVFLEEQVSDALSKGATVHTQLPIPDGLNGAYYPPTILTNITSNMRVWSEEVFGPVLPVVTFATEEEAIALANDTPYGLSARVITSDQERAWRVAAKIDAGTIEINQGNRWLMCNPFGGYKNSGMGREHGTLGFRELTQVKVISTSK